MAERCWPEDAGGLMAAAEAEQHKAVPAPFLTKTYQLVDDPSTNHIVSWGDDRVSTFVVWRPPEFARDLLPNYFKHNNFSSFVRQLNTYGFRKVVPERWEFANEFFRKGEKHLFYEIHRRKTSSASAAAASPPSPPLPFLPFYHFDEPPPPRFLVLGGGGAPGGAEALLEENERLLRSNAALVSELAHMRKLYNDIIYFVQNHVRPVAPSSVASPLLMSSFQLKATAAGSATSSSSLTIAEEPSLFENGEGSTMSTSHPKLFGVTLGGSSKRGLHLRTDEPSSTKPRLFLSKDDLGFNPMLPASPSSSS